MSIRLKLFADDACLSLSTLLFWTCKCCPKNRVEEVL